MALCLFTYQLRRPEDTLPIQDQLALESETDEARSDVFSDQDEEMHFELRLDPAEDLCNNDVETIPPPPVMKKALCQTKERPFSWKTDRDEDATPRLRFLPAREPGVQLRTEDNPTPLDLFKLFFPESAVETLCRNTNKQAARRVKSRHGDWSRPSVPCPKSVVEYNKFMGGVDLSDQLIQYYTTQHRTEVVLDIAATNAFILHKELKKKESMSHKAFIEELSNNFRQSQIFLFF